MLLHIYNLIASGEYEEVLEYDVSLLEPYVTFGYKPDQVKSVIEMQGTKIDQVYEVFAGKKEVFSLTSKFFKVEKFKRVGFYPAPEKSGAFGLLLGFFKRIKLDSIMNKIFYKIFEVLKRIKILNQKMLFVCSKSEINRK